MNCFKKMVIAVSVLGFLAFTLNSCSKDEEKEPEPEKKTITVDLNKPEYSILKNIGFTMVVQEVNLLNTVDGFYASSTDCPHCDGIVHFSNHYWNIWECDFCGSEWGVSGLISLGPTTARLKTYTVIRSGDILTIDLN